MAIGKRLASHMRDGNGAASLGLAVDHRSAMSLHIERMNTDVSISRDAKEYFTLARQG